MKKNTSALFGFKEWALVCEALGTGHQSLLLRKGGIAEGRDGFGFEHQEFFLFPTWFHGQVEKIRLQHASAIPLEAPEELSLEYCATIEWSGLIEDRKKIAQLEQLHILQESVINERFSYNAGDGKEGLYVAFVRVYRIHPPIRLPMEKRFGGCRSWVALPEMPEAAFVSVLSDEEHEARRSKFTRALGLGSMPST
ncbi:MAG: DUF1802 family protein [Chthoniobacterales bacterium]